ncbi:MAG: DMT family transporter [Cytophagales bacterium]
MNPPEKVFSLGVWYMLAATFLFTLMNIFVKLVPHIPVMEIILFRSLISLIMSYSVIRYNKISPWGNNKRFLFLRGFFGVLALVLYFTTLQNMPLASAVTIRYLTPIFTAMFGIYLLGEKVFKTQWLFFAMSLAGIILIKGFDTRISTIHFLMGVGSAFFSGIAYNSIRKLRFTDHPMVIIMYFPIIALPFCIIYSFFDWVTPVGLDWLYLLLIGILTQFAQYFMTKAYQADEAQKVSTINYVGFIFALAAGIFIFDEHYSLKIIFGMLLVLGGVILNIFYKNYRYDRMTAKKD